MRGSPRLWDKKSLAVRDEIERFYRDRVPQPGLNLRLKRGVCGFSFAVSSSRAFRRGIGNVHHATSTFQSLLYSAGLPITRLRADRPPSIPLRGLATAHIFVTRFPLYSRPPRASRSCHADGWWSAHSPGSAAVEGWQRTSSAPSHPPRRGVSSQISACSPAGLQDLQNTAFISIQTLRDWPLEVAFSCSVAQEKGPLGRSRQIPRSGHRSSLRHGRRDTIRS